MIPRCKRALNGKTPAEAAKAYIDGSKLDDPAVRKQLYQGGGPPSPPAPIR